MKSQYAETSVVFIEPPVTSSNPNNPAGLVSLVQSIEGAQFESLNEKFFLDWLFIQENFTKIFKNLDGQARKQTLDHLLKQGINEARIGYLLNQLTPILKATLHKQNTYTNSKAFLTLKRALSDLTKIYSAPFIVGKNPEWVRLERNTTDYYHSGFKYDRRSLSECGENPALFKDFFEHELKRLGEVKPAVIGLSVTHPDQLVPAFQFAKMLKSALPNTIVIFGGNTISRRFDTWGKQDELNTKIFNPNRESNGFVDALVISEGERSITTILEELYKNPNTSYENIFKNVPGVIYNKNGKIVFNPPTSFEPEAFHKNQNWAGQLSPGFMPSDCKIFSIVLGRGCVYECNKGGCDFCAISKGYIEPTQRLIEIHRAEIPNQLTNNRKWEQRQIPFPIVAERIKEAHEAGVKIVDFTDEQLTLHQIQKIIQSLSQLGLNKGEIPDITFSCYMRIDETGDPVNYPEQHGKAFRDLLCDQAFVNTLAKGGLKFAQFGLETTYPPKIGPMRKGTNTEKIIFFQTILENFHKAGIMSHIFILAANPLSPEYLTSQDTEPGLLAAERKLLGRNIKPDDLEIIEALYNLEFLQRNREYITTLKQTAYKLSFGSEHSLNPERYGLQLKANQPDLAVNLSFKYLPDCGPKTQVVQDMLLLYELWKKERLPTQPVAQEYMYHQRMIPGVEVHKLALAHPPGPERLTTNEQEQKQLLLGRLWQRLVGEQYAEGQAKLKKHNQSNQPLKSALLKLRENNMIIQIFPNGFSDYEDLYTIVKRLEDLR